MSVDRLPWSHALLEVALADFPLRRSDEHGPTHWARVKVHGLTLARHYGVNPAIPALFALFHDCRRENEYEDPGHGPRAADLIEELAQRGRFPQLSTIEIGWLQRACAQHSDGYIDAPRAVQVCWDADRLDLGRVGIRPNPARLCTELAREDHVRARAYQWSRGRPYRLEASDQELAFSAWMPSPRTTRSYRLG